jgi:hypothetical protein
VVAAGVTQPDAVAKVLYETADRAPAERNGAKKGDKWDEKYGFGRVDAAAAVAKAHSQPNGARALLALALAALSVLALRRRGQLGLSPRGGFALGLASGAAGPLFFLPWLGVSVGGASFLAQGLPSWDLGLLGAAWHGNLLFFSALVPVLAVGLLASTRARGLVAGLSLGVAAHLAYSAFSGHVDLSLPGSVLDSAWLLGNAALAGLLGHLTLKRA